MKITIEKQIKTPTVPNYILHETGEGKTRLGDLTNEVLEQIADEWRSQLLDKAEHQRKNPEPTPRGGGIHDRTE